MRVLGISALYHDSAAALIEDGRVVAAAQEERFTRKKHDSDIPRHAITACLKLSGSTLNDVDLVAFYEKPFLKFERLVETYAAFAPKGFSSFRRAVPLWIREKLFQKNFLVNELTNFAPGFDWTERLIFSEHHLSHAASAYFPSPFEKAAILTMDGVGEWATTSLAMGDGNAMEIIKEIHFPHSIGLLYSAFTYYLGFRVNSGEYKVMGLAPFGNPIYRDIILERLIDVKDDGSFRLNQKYFNYCTGLTMTNHHFSELFAALPRKSEAPLTQFHMDIAASIQAVVEEVVLRLTRSIKKETDATNLCLAGGVALNCVANGKVLRDGKFKHLWIQPAAGDAGGALGAALVAYHLYHSGERKLPHGSDAMSGSFLGPHYSTAEIEDRLTKIGANFQTLELESLLDQTAEALAGNEAVGWFQDRMEFGPRALGARSILGNPADPHMQQTLNLKVKKRESFRPFAPAVLRDELTEWFDLNEASPYMLLTCDVSKKHLKTNDEGVSKYIGLDRLRVQRSDVPAVTHVDNSARVQTVTTENNPRFHQLIKKFSEKTGIPILVNTSFNVRGEPIVCTPEDAFRCFMATELDVLAIGNCFLKKKDQNPTLSTNYKETFEPD